MNRASLLAPPVGWICHACGWSSETKPERCPKCGGSAFEQTGAAEAVREAERKAEGLGPAAARRHGDSPVASGLAAAHRKETVMTEFKCVDGCGRKVSRSGGRCRTCAGLKRRNKKRNKVRNKKTTRPAPAKSPGRPPKNPGEFPAPPVTTLTVAEALKAAGFAVKDVHVQEATLLVRLTT